MRQIFWIILIVVAVILSATWYVNRSKAHVVNSGDVFVRGPGGDKPIQTAKEAPEPQPDAQPEPDAPSAPQTQATTATPPAHTAPAVVVPAADSISRNPPNGMIFAGTGRFQLYRQGDITWRLNTDSGEACILFATDTEWRKPRVYQHGCGAS